MEAKTDKFSWITKYRVHFIFIALISTIISSFGLSVRGFSEPGGLMHAIVSLSATLLCYPMAYFVLLFQVGNPFCSRKVLNFFCQFFIYFFGIAGVAYTILTPLDAIFSSQPELAIANLSLPGFIFAYAAYKIRKKYVLSKKEWAQKR